MTTKRLSEACPPWLELHPDGTRYVFVAAKAKAVAACFEIAQRKGLNATATQLNADGHPTLGSNEIWTAKDVQRLLDNKFVYGDDRRGYPALISDAAKDAVEAAAKARAERQDGRTSAGHRNLFSGLMHCECGNALRFLPDIDVLRCQSCSIDHKYGPLEFAIVEDLFETRRLPLATYEPPMVDGVLVVMEALDQAHAELDEAWERVDRLGPKSDDSIYDWIELHKKQGAVGALTEMLEGMNSQLPLPPKHLTRVLWLQYERCSMGLDVLPPSEAAAYFEQIEDHTVMLPPIHNETDLRDFMSAALRMHINRVLIDRKGAFVLEGPILELLREHEKPAA